MNLRTIAMFAAGSIIVSGVARAAEGPMFDVAIDSLITAETITMADSLGPGFKAHLNFPYMQQRADGSLLVQYQYGQTQSGNLVSGKQAISTDDGQNWTTSTSLVDGGQSQLIKPAGQFSRGYSIGFSTADPLGQSIPWNNSSFSSIDGGLSWIQGASSFDPAGAAYTVVSGNFGRVVEVGGTQFMAAFGKRAGASSSESLLFASTDNGINWTRRSTISQYVPGTDLGVMDASGPSETGLVELDNGDLLAVFRAGQPFPNTDVDAVSPSLFVATSTDQGFTWSAPKTLGVAGVFPNLHKLADGSVALTYGRYGAKVMFVDPAGKRWSTPTAIYTGPGSGHTDMRQLSDGRYAYAYDQSGFYPPPWNGAVPSGFVYDNDQSANLKIAILDINQLPVVEDYDWVVEYHGDTTPDQTAVPWLAGSVGATSVRLWAELGQDYMRIESGSSGPNNLQNYRLLGSDPLWDPLDFQDGVVVDIRARVGDSQTDDGAASLLIGDGANGTIALSLSGASEVNLTGGSGAGGVLTYTDGTFSTLDWHLYRLIIEPNDLAGGQLRASLFVDGDWVTPILTQTIASSAFNGLIFGDRVSTENGIFDVDFLRFSGLAVDIQGDLNGDGFVGIDDLNIVLSNWNQNVPPGNPLADPSGDGFVGIDDLNTVLSNWNAGIPPTDTANIPEPASAALLILGSLALLRRAGL